jgi:hypothetical protein
MPEHRAGTPGALRDLESFLWWDFDASETWPAWTEARGWDEAIAHSNFVEAVEIQRSLRQLEAANNGMPPALDALERLNRAIRDHNLRPRAALSGLATARMGTERQATASSVISQIVFWQRPLPQRDGCHHITPT